ncbi:MAG: prolipoprotein diacylglyceryl transferase [Flavobacteriia bacterium]|jgi:phosphatidylglycerol:prolipoprotein diacylglycerol transferase|nr:prolipoprotein diacylglyceryl transferase [Cryomorphaceae bacterium]
MIQSIHWAVDSQLIDGWRTPNLYGLLFVSGIIMGYFVIRKMFRAEQVEDKILDTLVTYMVLATIIGARLGHVLFYGPYWDKIANGQIVERGYFSHPSDIVKIWEGGLASHGAAVAILIALFIFTKKVSKRSYIWILDRIAAPIAIAATFIRLGNLVNHEMVGYVTDVPWAFEFQYYFNEAIGNYDPTPRHPAQLYEAICYFISFGILLYLYWKLKKWQQPGFVFGSFLILIFGSRIICEFFKLGQTARDYTLPLNTGQLLSIPLVIAGIYLVMKAAKKTTHEA